MRPSSSRIPRRAVLGAAAGALALTAPGVASAAPTDTTSARVRAFVAREALGSSAAVLAARSRWSAEHGFRGGQVTASSTGVSGRLAAVLRRARTGASSYAVDVPTPGVYRVSLVLPASPSVQAMTLLRAQGVLVDPVVTPQRAASYVSVSVPVTGRTLRLGLSGARLAVSGLQVTGLRALPGGASRGVPVRLVAAPLPSSGLPPRDEPAPDRWASGAWPGGAQDSASATAFAAYRGRSLDVISVATPRLHWADIATNDSALSRYDGMPGTLSIALPLLPFDRQSTLSDVISGAHDADFQAFARQLVAHHRASSYVRLGWEFNGDWQPWAAFDPKKFTAAFRRAVTAMRSVDPAVRIDWDGNYGPSQVQLDPFTQLYPGDSYVDVVGVDAYDRKYYHVHDAASWDAYLHGVGGLDSWLHFAQSRHRPLSVPEWALFVERGDNPYYLNKMHGWFAANARSIGYECYFSEAEADIRSSLSHPDQNPKSSAVYAALWGR